MNKIIVYPTCSGCGRPIRSTSAWKIGEEIYHNICAENVFVVNTQDFVSKNFDKDSFDADLWVVETEETYRRQE